MGRLRQKEIDHAKPKHGRRALMLPDGDGLYLQVTKGARGVGRSWVLRYQIDHVRRDMGLGPYPTVSLAAAREKARELRERIKLDDVDPIEARQRAREAKRIEAAKAMTFDQAAAEYVKDNAVKWTNPKHAAQWTTTLRQYASPIIGSLPVQAIDTALVTQILRPIWQDKPETASRLRGRIETVLAWAAAHGYRTADNPARWQGHLKMILPKRSAVRAVQHMAALPYAELPTFMAALRARQGIPARALEFCILTAARSGEVLGAMWDEIDLEARTWVIPAERMKAGRTHRVPLCDAAVAILEALPKGGDRIFAIGPDAMRIELKRMGRDATVHGMRSAFKDWSRERTSFASEIAEAALAHVVGDATERAYARGDLFAKRAALMTAWADYCSKPTAASGNVVAIRG